MRSGDEFVLDAPDHVPAIWGAGTEVAWARGEPLMIVGPTGAGKTTIAQQVTRGLLGLQDELLGMPIEARDRRVGYLALDRPQQIARAFRRSFTEADRPALRDRLLVWSGPLRFDPTDDSKALAELAIRANRNTLIVDGLGNLAPNLSDQETGARLNRAFQTLIANDVELLLLHHQRKATAQNPKPNTVADVYGSVWLTAGMGSVLLVWGSPGDPVVEVRSLKAPAHEIGPWQVRHDHELGISTRLEQRDLIDLIRTSERGLTVAEAAAHLFGPTPTRADRERARRRLRALARDRSDVVEEDSGEQIRFQAVTPCAPDRAPSTRDGTDDHESLTQAARNGSRPVTPSSPPTAPLRSRAREGAVHPEGSAK